MSILKGRTAIVTGAGRGIGRGIAHLLAREGAKVVVADNGSAPEGSGRDSSVAEQVALEIRNSGGEALADAGDVSDWKSAGRLIDKALDAWGKLDILVNVAGNMRIATILDATEDDFDAVIRVHLRGTFNTSHFAARHWVKRKEYGRLINTSSIVAFDAHPTLLSYCTAKAGIVGFTRACANALVAYGVTANVLVPSGATRLLDFSLQAQREVHVRETGKLPSEAAAGTQNDPAHVAPMVAFLASERAGHITGRVFGASGRGGYTLWSLPRPERQVKLVWPQDYERMSDAFEAVLGAGLEPADLPYPMASLEAEWRPSGAVQPRWDFKTKP